MFLFQADKVITCNDEISCCGSIMVEEHENVRIDQSENKESTTKLVFEEREDSNAQDDTKTSFVSELLEERSLVEKYLAVVLELESTKREVGEARCLLEEREEQHAEEVARLRARVVQLLEESGANEELTVQMDQKLSGPNQGLQVATGKRHEVRDQIATSTPNATLGTEGPYKSVGLETSYLGKMGAEEQRK